MAEGAKEGTDEGFSFVDKVRLMMYTEQEKEAFLIDKKEKEEKKKAKKKAKEAAGEESKAEKQTFMGQLKSFFVGESQKDNTKEAPKASPEETALPPTTAPPPTTPETAPASPDKG